MATASHRRQVFSLLSRCLRGERFEDVEYSDLNYILRSTMGLLKQFPMHGVQQSGLLDVENDIGKLNLLALTRYLPSTMVLLEGK
jgi:hypothetical protein